MSLAKHTFVTVKGLQSEAGKKLNGAHGIVISSKQSTDATGNERYPVRIYAKIKEGTDKVVPIIPTDDKKIKLENLEECAELAKNDVFREAAFAALQRAQMGPTDDIPTMAWWLSCYCKVRPDELNMSCNLANVLRGQGKIKEASDMMWDCLQRGAMDDFNFKNYGPDAPKLAHDVALTFAYAGEHLEEAFESALKIPYEDVTLEDPEFPTNTHYPLKFLANDALDTVVGALNEACNKPGPTPKNYAKLRLKGTKIRMKREPESANCAFNLGASYFNLQYFLEAAQCYRRALDLPRGRDDPEQIKHCLIQAQMKCPGGKLDGMVVMGEGMNGLGQKKVMYMSKDQFSAVGGMHGFAALGPGKHKFQEATYPTDPDDAAEFPASLLEQVHTFPASLLAYD